MEEKLIMLATLYQRPSKWKIFVEKREKKNHIRLEVAKRTYRKRYKPRKKRKVNYLKKDPAGRKAQNPGQKKTAPNLASLP